MALITLRVMDLISEMATLAWSDGRGAPTSNCQTQSREVCKKAGITRTVVSPLEEVKQRKLGKT